MFLGLPNEIWYEITASMTAHGKFVKSKNRLLPEVAKMAAVCKTFRIFALKYSYFERHRRKKELSILRAPKPAVGQLRHCGNCKQNYRLIQKTVPNCYKYGYKNGGWPPSPGLITVSFSYTNTNWRCYECALFHAESARFYVAEKIALQCITRD